MIILNLISYLCLFIVIMQIATFALQDNGFWSGIKTGFRTAFHAWQTYVWVVYDALRQRVFRLWK